MTYYCEVPFVSATTLDDTLTSSGPGKAAIQKYRQEMRKQLDHGVRISLGRGGTFQLTSVPALACVATATRWNMKDARKLAGIYKKAGFLHLTRSKDYKRAMSLVSQAVQARVRSNETKTSRTAVVDMIPVCWEELTTDHEVVRNVTMLMHDIFVKVDQLGDQIKRLAGRLVRFEGGNALVTVDCGNREELRTVDGNYLKSAGIHRNGSPFVLHEYRWSPDTTMSMFFPALELNYDAAAEEVLMQRLKNRESGLPEPPDGLLPADVVAEENPSNSSGHSIEVETANTMPEVSEKVTAG